jgi:hypothetical protein
MRSRALVLMAFSLAGLALVAGGAAAQGSDPTPADDWFEVDYDLAVSEGLAELTLDGQVAIHEAESQSELEASCGSSCTADELREAYDRASEERKEAMVDGIEQNVAERTAAVLESVTGEAAETNATLDQSTIESEPEGSPYQPTIDVDVTGSSPLSLVQEANLTDEQVDALFRMGARVATPVETTVRAGTNLTVTLSTPDAASALEADGPTGTTVPADAVTWTLDSWDAPDDTQLDAGVRLGDPDVVVPDQERVDVSMTLDMSEVDVHYWGAVTGGTPASLGTELTVDGEVRAVRLPEAALPDAVELDLLSADALRIGLDAGLVPEQRVITFEDQARSSIKEAYRGLLGADVRVEGGIVPSTLEAEATASPPGTGPPVRLDMGASEDVDFPPEEGGLGGASGFEVTRIDQGTIELPEVPTPGDRPANVSMVLPPGVELVYDDVQNGDVTTSTGEDGNTVVAFESGGGQPATVQGAELVITSGLLWELLWPLLLGLLLLLILAAVVVYLVLRDRRDEGGPGGRGTDAEPDADAAGPSSAGG